MTGSDWGDWLPAAVADSDPDSVALWYLGCNGFILKAGDGTTILVDPYLGTGDPPRTVRMIPVPFDPEDVRAADAVLATHEHTDHVHGPSQAPILANTGATFVGPDASVEKALEGEGWTAEWDVGAEQFETVDTGDSRDVGGVRISVEPANDPDAEQPVSYLLEYDGVTVFHGGDGRPDDVLAEIGSQYDVDLAILAFGSSGMLPDKRTGEPTETTWYSDESEVAEAARQLRADVLLPSHWDMWKGLTADPTALHDHVRSFDHPKRLEIVEIGDRVDL